MQQLAVTQVPPPPNAALISSLSTTLMVLGVVLVLCALPPVRAAVGDLADRIAAFGRPRRRPAAVASATSPAEDAPRAPETRREIEEFDLDLFSNGT
jgi:hypothetical protein